MPTTTDSMPKVLLTLRPFGYLAVTVVYLVLLAVLIVFGWGGLFLGIDRGFGVGGSGYDVFVCVLVVAVAGPILGAALGIATALVTSLVMLGGLAFVRSLMPSYADTPLTHTVHSDNAVGPPRLTKGAVSLLPVRRGRFAELALVFNLAAQGLSWRVLLACAWLGVADVVTAGWVKWPVTGPWVAVGVVISSAFLAAGVVGIVRAVRRPDGRPAGRPASWSVGSDCRRPEPAAPSSSTASSSSPRSDDTASVRPDVERRGSPHDTNAASLDIRSASPLGPVARPGR